MNANAVFLGLLYGVLSIGICYGISMVTSGLFVRPYYRLYARTLIGTCAAMLIAPGLRLLATYNPELATAALTGSQYIVIGIVGNGIVRFNRQYLRKVYMERATAAYFAFGTLAYAAIVTLGFLHIAVTTTPGWKEQSLGFVSAVNYGPLLLLLAGLVFHTDIHLKQANNSARNFSRFTFLGYAISFLGVGLSLLPVVAKTFGNIELVGQHSPLLQNFFSIQSLMLAMLLYGWLIWTYESIPPLYLFLFALIGEYHLVVTQFAVAKFGFASLAVTCLPLCVGLYALDWYFSTWNTRKRIASGEQSNAHSNAFSPHFSRPFRIVGLCVATGIFAASLWSRFADTDATSHSWLAITFSTYSLFAFTITALRKQPQWIYLAGALLGLAGLAGTEHAFDSIATLATGSISLAFVVLALLARRLKFRRTWQTPFADCGLLTAVCVTCVASSRHLLSDSPYQFAIVGQLDAMALSFASIAFLISAYLYRSWLPVFASLIAISLVAPPWAAVVSLAAAFSAFILKNNFDQEKLPNEETRLRFFGVEPLGFADQFPAFYYRPLAIAAVPLAFAGLTIATFRIVSGDLQFITLFGISASAGSLLLLTLQSRNRWLYISAILTSYFAMHVVAHGILFRHWNGADAYQAHLFLAAIASLVNWGIALSFRRMSATWSPRVREPWASRLRIGRELYAETLLEVVTAIATALLVVLIYQLVRGATFESTTLAISAITTTLLAWAAQHYRSQYWSYLSLASVSVAAASFAAMLHIPHWAGSPAIAGLIFGICNFMLIGIRRKKSRQISRNLGSTFTRYLICSDRTELWLAPTACFAIAGSAVAVAQSVSFDGGAPIALQFARGTPLIYLLVGATLLFLTRAIRIIPVYLLAIAFIFSSAQTAVHLVLVGDAQTTAPVTAHLMVAAVQMGITCLIVTLIASWLNSRTAGPGPRLTIAIREFYVGILVHAVFATSLLILFAFATREIQGNVTANVGARLAIGIVLGGTFSWLAVLYRSRIPVYCALLSLCISLVVITNSWGTELSAIAIAFITSVSALAMGAASWSIIKSNLVRLGRATFQDSALACWRHPPLPLYSADRSLWSIPLAHSSVVLCIASLATLATRFNVFAASSLTVVLAAVVLFIVAAALCIATRTHTFGWGIAFASPDSGDSLAAQSDMIERGFLYFAAVLVAGTGTHFLLEATTSQDLMTLRIAKHLLLQSMLILLGWCIATLLMTWLHRREESATKSNREEVTQNRWLYAGLLQHITLAIAGITSVCYVPILMRTGPTAGIYAIGLGGLFIYFALAGASYRSRVPIYFAIGTGIAMMAQLLLLASPWLPAIDTFALPLLSLVGLSFASLAIAIEFATSDSMLRTSLTLLSPTESRREASLHSLWASPLRNTAALISCGSLITAFPFLTSDNLALGPVALLAAILGIASTALILARLYRSPALSYSAITILMISCVPILELGGESTTHLGSILAAHAMLLWVAGFIIERLGIRFQQAERESHQKLATWLYGQPLIRCSAIFACVAMIHGLWIWHTRGFQSSQSSIVIATGLGAVTLMLNARSMTVLHKIAWARVLVYLGCLSVTGCWLASYSMTWKALSGLGPNAALTSLAFSIVGWLLIEAARKSKDADPAKAETKLIFGEPISHFASFLSVVSVALAVGTFGMQPQWFAIGAPFSADMANNLTTLGLTLLLVSGTCLVSVRAQGISHWLYPSSLLASSGLIAVLQGQMNWTTETLLVNWMLLMVGLAAASRMVSRGRRIQKYLSIDEREISRPLLAWPAISSFAVLLAQVTSVGAIAFFGADHLNWPWLPVSVLCGIVFFQAAYIQRSKIWLHAIIASLISGFVGWSLQDSSPVSPGLVLALFGFGLVSLATGWRLSVGKRLLAWLALDSSHRRRKRHERDLLAWGTFLLTASLPTSVALVMGHRSTLMSLSCVLCLITLATLISGIRWKHVPAAAIAMTGALASVGATMVALGWQNSLVTNAALTSATLALGYLGLAAWLTRTPSETPSCETSRQRRFLLGSGKTALLMSHTLAGIALLISAISILRSHGLMSTSMALAAATVYLFFAAFITRKELFAYAGLSCVLVTIASTFYLVFDFAIERTAGAAFFVIGYSLVLYLVNICATRAAHPGLKVFRTPSYYLALAVPILLAVTLPIHQSGPASLALIAAGAFYLTVAFEAQEQWPLYIAAALFNVAVYLWVPSANQLTGLYQLYVIPAAATVLVFAQLHHRDLNHSILTSIRLAASGTILAVSTFEVFFSQEATLIQFVSVLVLSLAGTALGIALRVKPFVYIGIAFLILNVVGQLGVQFHDEGGIVRALILIGVGIVVLGIMIFFNIHRERILRQYRGFLVDESWE